MLKIVYCCARREDVSPEKFHDYWLHQHGPTVKARQKALGMVKYIQSHTVEPELNDELRASRGLEPPYDGITEVWWESADSLRAALASAEGAKAMQELIEDESTFLDFTRCRVFMTEEHVIF
jgi:uncharacterized protein (TIGR02118 family)